MDMTIELHVKDASRRAVENIKQEVRQVLAGQGFRVAETEVLSPESGAQAALAATPGSTARIRLYTTEGGAV